MKVLFLSSWYPSKLDAMSGLFVQKHAEAVARKEDVFVIYVQTTKTVSEIELEYFVKDNVKTLVVYSPIIGDSISAKIQKQISYLKSFLLAFKFMHKEWGKPDITHSNILTRTGVIALLYKLFCDVPYVIMEHWTRYLPQNSSYKGFLRHIVTKLVLSLSSKLIVVSNSLKSAMQSYGLKGNYIVINNVVDDFFFENYIAEKREIKRILHVSCFDEMHKNVKGILRTIEQLHKVRTDFELVLLGTGIDFDEIVEYSKILEINDCVRFLGEKSPLEVKSWMQQSDFLLLFSNYENAPVVISESLSIGMSVISTKVGGIPEMINETNGVLVQIGNEQELFESINKMLDCFSEYDSATIRKEAYNKYSYDSVSAKLIDIYKSVVEQ